VPPGDGGAGGSVDLRYVEAPAVPLRLIADGCPPGQAGACGQPGPANDPGLGGRNRVYLPGSILGHGSEDDASSEIASGAPARAASGAPSRIGNVARPPPPAAAGQKGSTAARQVTTDEMADACDDRDLELVFESATTAGTHGNLERARARSQWVAALARNASNEGGAGLRDEASASSAAPTPMPWSASACRAPQESGEMAREGCHEPVEKMSQADRAMHHRAIQSPIEQLEAVDRYHQRIDLFKNPEQRAILAHTRDEEKEHAAMLLEWIRRDDATFDHELRDDVFAEKPLTHD
jgi:hypothetical protein